VTGWRTMLLVLMIAATAACGRDPDRGYDTIPREQFIATNVALRELDRQAPEVDSLRQEVLAQHGVTEDDLRAFVMARSHRPDELAAVWNEIHLRLTERTPAVEPVEMDTAELMEEDAQTQAGTTATGRQGMVRADAPDTLPTEPVLPAVEEPVLEEPLP
jgi:hypothetical protein